MNKELWFVFVFVFDTAVCYVVEVNVMCCVRPVSEFIPIFIWKVVSDGGEVPGVPVKYFTGFLHVFGNHVFDFGE